ncbi:MAG: hypothetical protein D6834_03495 [Aquificota bacterium]|nr:MAG: hypothetical protein D6834_03495 [Aquificota bacterium]
MVDNILILLEVIFLISLIGASIASVKVWYVSKKLSNEMKKLVPEGYTHDFFDIDSPKKYKNLNISLQKIINMYEDNFPTSKTEVEINNLKENFKLSEKFIKDLKVVLENYKNDVAAWKKFGKMSGFAALITGALSFIIYYLFR